MTQKKKLAVLNLGAHGHINPTLPVVQELVRRGVEVVYFATEEYRSAVTATGARFRSYDSVFVGQSKQDDTKGPSHDKSELAARFPLRLVTEAEHVLPDFVAALREEAPDALIYDSMCLAGRFAASALKLPAMHFRPSYVANEHFSLGKKLGAIDPGHPARVEFREKAAALCERYNLKLGHPAELMQHAEALNVVFMPRAFHPFGATFDERFVFAGPSIAPRPAAGTWTPPAGDQRPLLFISLGTVFNDWPEFFSHCFEAFGGSPWNVVVAIGHKIDPRKLGPTPANFTVEKHVPQLDVLAKARLFITHGGMGSAQESLWFGVPMIVIPQMMEQAQTAERVVELGLGQAFLNRGLVNPASLAQAVRTVDNDAGYRARAQAMQVQERSAGGFHRAADAILAQLEKVSGNK